ncbi:MAG: hypothetical protein FJ090_01910 [Deltaproteobacteria bacterium]|nr:hypothetical protein [Deltaproteobacteria bacterium]
MILSLALALANESRDYARTVAAATEEARVYDGWYTALLVRATRVDEALRATQSEHVAAITGQGAAGAAGTDLVLAVSGQFKDELRFGTDGTTPWTARVSAGSTSCRDIEITTRKKPSTLDEALYPHLTAWDQLVILHLDPGACGGREPDGLLLTSARGRAELRWAAP